MRTSVEDLAAKRRFAEQMIEDEFLQTEWDGCQHLDCLSECRQSIEGGHCERFARAFDTWRAKRPAFPPSERGVDK